MQPTKKTTLALPTRAEMFFPLAALCEPLCPLWRGLYSRCTNHYQMQSEPNGNAAAKAGAKGIVGIQIEAALGIGAVGLAKFLFINQGAEGGLGRGGRRRLIAVSHGE